jgi:hypothetical protein
MVGCGNFFTKGGTIEQNFSTKGGQVRYKLLDMRYAWKV